MHKQDVCHVGVRTQKKYVKKITAGGGSFERSVDWENNAWKNARAEIPASKFIEQVYIGGKNSFVVTYIEKARVAKDLLTPRGRRTAKTIFNIIK